MGSSSHRAIMAQGSILRRRAEGASTPSVLPAHSLSSRLMEARDEKRLSKLQAQLQNVKLLIIDELGCVPLSQVGAELLFEVFSQRYERGSTMVTSNLPLGEWPSVFQSERVSGALLDWLPHHVHILELNGDSYSPWLCFEWLVTGKGVGGTQLSGERTRLDRDTALRTWTDSTSFSGEHDQKRSIAPGLLADFAILNEDVLAAPDERLHDIEAVLTIVGGRVGWAATDFAPLMPPLPPLKPDWSPVNRFGGLLHRGLPWPRSTQ